MILMTTENALILSALDIEPGESKEYQLTWNISKADALNLGLRLARLRQGATFKVLKLGGHEIRIEATESRRGYRINGAPPVDLRSLERDLNRRR